MFQCKGVCNWGVIAAGTQDIGRSELQFHITHTASEDLLATRDRREKHVS